MLACCHGCVRFSLSFSILLVHNPAGYLRAFALQARWPMLACWPAGVAGGAVLGVAPDSCALGVLVVWPLAALIVRHRHYFPVAMLRELGRRLDGAWEAALLARQPAGT